MCRVARYLVVAFMVILGTGPGGAVGAANAACAPFPQTGYQVCGGFLAYWQQHGGLAINGYPLTDERIETLEDGRQYTVQWFERVRMEYHPEAPEPYTIQLGQFGRLIHPADPPQGYQTGTVYYDPNATKVTAPIYFPQTGHHVSYEFSIFWLANGGLAQFGYPLTEGIRETLEDGRTYQVQYFERARFELHPENPAANRILLGQFGRRILAQR